MKKNNKTRARTSHTPITPTAAQWHEADAALTALRTAFAPLLQPLGADERRQLLRMGAGNEPFVADYVALLQAQPDLIPALLRPADTLRDWQTRAEIIERQLVLVQLLQELADTRAGLEGDCFAGALAGYRMLARDGSHPGLEAAVEPLREHMSLRVERSRRTRALKKAAAAPGNVPGAATPPANLTMLPAAAPAPNALAA